MPALLQRFANETLGLFIEISPYLLLGFFFAGVLHVFLGEKYIRRHFARSGWVSIIKAALFGIPLPVCSCAVIPLAESLRRDGASKSATMAFLVSTPSSGVDSILATYALMGPIYALFRPLASLFSGIMVGVITHFKDREEEPTAPATAPQPEAQSRSTRKKIQEVFSYGFQVIPSEILKSLIIGVVIGGAISALVPADFGARYLLGSPILNYVVVLLISIPLYVCATGSIPIAAALIAKGVLPGAALALLIAGPATNSVTISFVYKKMGRKVAVYYILSIVLASVLCGLLLDLLTVSHITHIHGHSHAMSGEEKISLLKIASAILMILVFLHTRINKNFFNRLRRKKMTENNSLTISIPDMNCQHCQIKISRCLDQMPDVQGYSIDLGTRAVTLETTTPKDVILDRIRTEGYHPQ